MYKSVQSNSHLFSGGIGLDFCKYFGSHVHEIGPFMPSSPVFVEFMICAIYGPKCNNIWKKEFECNYCTTIF